MTFTDKRPPSAASGPGFDRWLCIAFGRPPSTGAPTPHRLLPVLALLAFGCAEEAPETRAEATHTEAIGRSAKVWLCHATASATNPYNLIHVSSNAWDGRGRNDHTLHVGDYEASGPDEECGYDSGDDGGGDDGGGDDGGGTGGDDGGGTGGDDGGGTGGDSGAGTGGDSGAGTGGEPPVCFTLGNEADCTAEPTCVWDGAVCLPGGFEI